MTWNIGPAGAHSRRVLTIGTTMPRAALPIATTKVSPEVGARRLPRAPRRRRCQRIAACEITSAGKSKIVLFGTGVDQDYKNQEDNEAREPMVTVSFLHRGLARTGPVRSIRCHLESNTLAVWVEINEKSNASWCQPSERGGRGLYPDVGGATISLKTCAVGYRGKWDVERLGMPLLVTR